MDDYIIKHFEDFNLTVEEYYKAGGLQIDQQFKE